MPTYIAWNHQIAHFAFNFLDNSLWRDATNVIKDCFHDGAAEIHINLMLIEIYEILVKIFLVVKADFRQELIIRQARSDCKLLCFGIFQFDIFKLLTSL